MAKNWKVDSVDNVEVVTADVFTVNEDHLLTVHNTDGTVVGCFNSWNYIVDEAALNA